ncbi:helix-turn-helix domain-containing protein [Actinoplanes sp. NBC_00393]|uniref:helix-turn-helix transcriptional regulator n=1 Tax=Actinoplanes sp. NBC_00393 TaxID=2975953 RepID=UPI002E23C4E2
MSASAGSDLGDIEILPLVVVAQAFPARPSALPDVRAFLRRHLTGTPISEDDIQALCDRVAEVLLDTAGASSSLQVSLRIFPDGAEVDVLGSADTQPAGEVAVGGRPAGEVAVGGRISAAVPRPPEPPALAPAAAPAPVAAEPALSFAAWLAAGLRREGMSMEAAARRLNVSTKTIGRWVSGATEPRLRDLSRIRAIFGEPPYGP